MLVCNLLHKQAPGMPSVFFAPPGNSGAPSATDTICRAAQARFDKRHISKGHRHLPPPSWAWALWPLLME